MDIIFSASIIAAFLAGMVALFAPCCITVLLPAYLASAFREKKHLLRMTFIFFAGIAVVLVPIGLGAAALAQLFRDFHREMYIVGGLIMVVLAVMAVLGKGVALVPMSKRLKAGLDVKHNKSVFLLGVFSGAATSCCAPVLAGAVTLAVVSGAFWKALLVTFAYVFGMTFPLFITAYFYEKFNLAETKFIKGKLWTLKLGAKTLYLHSTNLLAGLTFLLMGGILIFLGLSGNAFWSPAWQVKVGETISHWSESLTEVLIKVPEGIWAVLILGIFFFFLYRSKKNSFKP